MLFDASASFHPFTIHYIQHRQDFFDQNVAHTSLPDKAQYSIYSYILAAQEDKLDQRHYSLSRSSVQRETAKVHAANYGNFVTVYID